MVTKRTYTIVRMSNLNFLWYTMRNACLKKLILTGYMVVGKDRKAVDIQSNDPPVSKASRIVLGEKAKKTNVTKCSEKRKLWSSFMH